MPKKKKNTEENPEVVANCDHPEKGEVALSQHDIENLIITVRGEQVLQLHQLLPQTQLSNIKK